MSDWGYYSQIKEREFSRQIRAPDAAAAGLEWLVFQAVFRLSDGIRFEFLAARLPVRGKSKGITYFAAIGSACTVSCPRTVFKTRFIPKKIAKTIFDNRFSKLVPRKMPYRIYRKLTE